MVRKKGAVMITVWHGSQGCWTLCCAQGNPHSPHPPATEAPHVSSAKIEKPCS